MTLAAQVAALGSMTTAELAAEYERLNGRRPRYRSVPWMKKRIAHALQVAAYGGLSRAASAAVAELAASVALPVPREKPTTDALRPGTVFTREWHGKRIEAEVTADGFIWNDTRYSSLSAVAFAVTGSKWNGKLFFGLTGRKPRS